MKHITVKLTEPEARALFMECCCCSNYDDHSSATAKIFRAMKRARMFKKEEKS